MVLSQNTNRCNTVQYSLHLVDTFRHSHPRRTTFSHFSPVGAARLDRTYAATALQLYVAEASVGGMPESPITVPSPWPCSPRLRLAAAAPGECLCFEG